MPVSRESLPRRALQPPHRRPRSRHAPASHRPWKESRPRAMSASFSSSPSSSASSPACWSLPFVSLSSGFAFSLLDRPRMPASSVCSLPPRSRDSSSLPWSFGSSPPRAAAASIRPRPLYMSMTVTFPSAPSSANSSPPRLPSAAVILWGPKTPHCKSAPASPPSSPATSTSPAAACACLRPSARPPDSLPPSTPPSRPSSSSSRRSSAAGAPPSSAPWCSPPFPASSSPAGSGGRSPCFASLPSRCVTHAN